MTLLFRLGRFAASGAVGFVIEAIVLTVLVQGMDVNVYVSRLISFSLATLVTWQLNRRLSFDDRRSESTSLTREYARYLLVQVIGALVNLAAFSASVYVVPQWKMYVVLPLAIGAAFGMILNFVLLNLWVYRVEAEESSLAR